MKQRIYNEEWFDNLVIKILESGNENETIYLICFIQDMKDIQEGLFNILTDENSTYNYKEYKNTNGQELMFVYNGITFCVIITGTSLYKRIDKIIICTQLINRYETL